MATLSDIRGVGDELARRLHDAGFKTVRAVAQADPLALSAVRGLGGGRAVQVREAAQELLAERALRPRRRSVADPRLAKVRAKLEKALRKAAKARAKGKDKKAAKHEAKAAKAQKRLTKTKKR